MCSPNIWTKHLSYISISKVPAWIMVGLGVGCLGCGIGLSGYQGIIFIDATQIRVFLPPYPLCPYALLSSPLCVTSFINVPSTHSTCIDRLPYFLYFASFLSHTTKMATFFALMHWKSFLGGLFNTKSILIFQFSVIN